MCVLVCGFGPLRKRKMVASHTHLPLITSPPFEAGRRTHTALYTHSHPLLYQPVSLSPLRYTHCPLHIFTPCTGLADLSLPPPDTYSHTCTLHTFSCVQLHSFSLSQSPGPPGYSLSVCQHSLASPRRPTLLEHTTK